MNMNKKLIVSLLILTIISCKSNFRNIRTDETRDLLIGKWRYDNPKINDSEYYFYKDSTWKYIGKNYKKETIITKGKFYVGDDKEIFMRCYGSQHWPENSDTINDYKSSIGARVLFLRNDTLLVNNQEDYSTKYIKEK